MLTLRNELKKHSKTLEFFKDLPVDLKKHIQSFYISVLPTLRCPCCQQCHYPLYCYHYCKRACYALVLKKLIKKEQDDQDWLQEMKENLSDSEPERLIPRLTNTL